MKNEKQLVSIITVVYNGVNTIERTIKSVKAQTYKNIEYIIIDGGSTDGTIDIIEKNKKYISKYISEKDEGIYDAMNKGLRYATGDIIGIINADDWYAVDAIEQVVQFFNEQDVELVYGKLWIVNALGEMRKYPVYSLDTMWYQMAIPHPTTFIKRSVYEKYGMFDLTYRIAADYELLLRLYSEKVKFGFLNSEIAFFSKGGVSEIYSETCKREALNISRQYIGKCDQAKKVQQFLKEKEALCDFDKEMRDKPCNIITLLELFRGQKVQEIAIFGTGIWSEKYFLLLNDINVDVRFFLDNYREGLFYEKEILHPSDLKEKDLLILIAVKDGVDKIKEQLNDLGVKNHVSINELINIWKCNKSVTVENVN